MLRSTTFLCFFRLCPSTFLGLIPHFRGYDLGIGLFEGTKQLHEGKPCHRKLALFVNLALGFQDREKPSEILIVLHRQPGEDLNMIFCVGHVVITSYYVLIGIAPLI